MAFTSREFDPPWLHQLFILVSNHNTEIRSRLSRSGLNPENFYAQVNVGKVQKMQDEIDQLEGWRHENDALCRDFVFDDFVRAFSFMTRVAFLTKR